MVRNAQSASRTGAPAVAPGPVELSKPFLVSHQGAARNAELEAIFGGRMRVRENGEPWHDTWFETLPGAGRNLPKLRGRDGNGANRALSARGTLSLCKVLVCVTCSRHSQY